MKTNDMPLYCDDCGKKRSRWAAGPGRDNSGQLHERCNCNCGGWWVSHWAHHHHSRAKELNGREYGNEITEKEYVRWRVALNGETWWIKARGYREACSYALRRHNAYNSVVRYNWLVLMAKIPVDKLSNKS